MLRAGIAQHVLQENIVRSSLDPQFAMIVIKATFLQVGHIIAQHVRMVGLLLELEHLRVFNVLSTVTQILDWPLPHAQIVLLEVLDPILVRHCVFSVFLGSLTIFLGETVRRVM